MVFRSGGRRALQPLDDDGKLIFDTSNLQTIDYKRETALEKRRGTTFAAGGTVQASAS